ncbi:unnamed protein product, partial [Didymodactylos carnosus]
MSTIRLNLDKMIHLDKEIECIRYYILHSVETDSKIIDGYSQKMTQIKTITNDVRKLVRQLKQQLTVQQTVKRRIEIAQLHTVTHQLYLISDEHYKREMTYRENYKKRLKRHCSLTGRSLTEAELENLIEYDYPAYTMPSVMVDTQRHTLNRLTCQYHDIRKLESDIKELYDLFLEIAELIRTQDEKLMTIQEHTLQTEKCIIEVTTQTKESS